MNELDAARFDLLLGRAVARGAGRAIDMFVMRIEGLVSAYRGLRLMAVTDEE